jgi:hypothetical protein
MLFRINYGLEPNLPITSNKIFHKSSNILDEGMGNYFVWNAIQDA